jgi:hypothetical protein
MVSTFSQAADTAQNVLLMTIPGLALFYGGLVRTALHTKSQILAHSPPHEEGNVPVSATLYAKPVRTKKVLGTIMQSFIMVGEPYWGLAGIRGMRGQTPPVAGCRLRV